MSRYRPYPAYKDSGVEWLGDIPASWHVTRLRYCLRLITEKTERRERPVALENIESWSGRFFETDTEFQGEGIAFNKGDILFGKLRPYLAKVYLADAPGEAVGDFHVLRHAPSVVGRFSLYQMLNRDFIVVADSSTFGAKMPRVSWEFLGAMGFVLPPADEQAVIATFLDRETARLDALVAKQERLIALLKEKRQALISHAATKGLNPDAAMKDSGVEGLGQVPAHWESTRLKLVAQVQSGVAKGRDLAGVETMRVPYLRVANVQDGYLDLDDIAEIEIARHELPRYSLQPGDVLMNEGGDFDKLGRGHVWRGEISPCIHQNHVFAVRPVRIEPEWLSLLTSAEYGRFYFMSRSKQSTNLASISATNIGEFPVVVPQAAERRQILEWVSMESAKIDALIAKSRRSIDLLREHRTALISAAVTGKIDVRGAA